MKITLTEREVVNRLLEDTYANWTREAAEALAEYLCANYPDDEFDLVAIRSEYVGLTSEQQALEEFGKEVPIIAHLSNGGVIVAVYF